MADGSSAAHTSPEGDSVMQDRNESALTVRSMAARTISAFIEGDVRQNSVIASAPTIPTYFRPRPPKTSSAKNKSRFNELCAKHLDWSESQVATWIDNTALPYLKHWKVTCYDDPALRNMLQAQLSERDALCKKIVDLCKTAANQTHATAGLSQLSAGPSRYVARAAVDIHKLSMSNIKEWAEAFQQSQDGIGVGVELVLDVFVDLWTSGGRGRIFLAMFDGPLHGSRSSKRENVARRTSKGTSGHRQAGKKAGHKEARNSEESLLGESVSRPEKQRSGSGMTKSRMRNARRQEQNKLKRFKRVNLLPADADLAALQSRAADLREQQGRRIEEKKLTEIDNVNDFENDGSEERLSAGKPGKRKRNENVDEESDCESSDSGGLTEEDWNRMIDDSI